MILADKVTALRKKAGWSQEELAEQLAPEGCDSPLRRVTMAEASEYLALHRAAAPRIAFATMLCILSPVCLILLAGMSEVSCFGISEDAAAGVLFGAVMLVVKLIARRK